MSGAVFEMRGIVRSLFGEGKITALAGFVPGSGSPWSRPAVIRSTADAERLTWDATCWNNLAVYLPMLAQESARKGGARASLPAPPSGHPWPRDGARASLPAPPSGHPWPRDGARASLPAPPPRIGFIVKGCDMRAITALIKERQAAREDLVLIGMPCRGMLDRRRMEAALDDVSGIEDGGSEIVAATADGTVHSLEREPLVRDACRTCMFPAAERVDVMVQGASRKPAVAGEADRSVREFAALDAARRWALFQEEMSRCIRCYACRQACPMCYCKECFAETNNPAWIGATVETTDVSIFHLGRILHQAGRCVECGACAGACPMGIDLATFTKKIAADARELFGFTADFSPETLPPLCTWKDDDPQVFISDPEKGCGCGR
jgi:formate dehydrogenase subunit beta